MHNFNIYQDIIDTSPEFKPREVPPVVQRANWALRKAANSLSLCFFDENKEFIFFGDIYKKEIDIIISDLQVSGKTAFGFMITPHHGGHWSNSLLNMRFERTASSCGVRLHEFLRPDYKYISNSHHVTWFSGDLSFVRSAGKWMQYP